MSQWDFITTTTMLLLCSVPDLVDGETSGFGTASNLRGVSQKKALLIMKCIFPFIKGLSIHDNLITHMRAYVTCCIHNIGHNNGIHTRAHTHTYTFRHDDGRMSLEFIEMVPFISYDCTVTACTHVWLLQSVWSGSF